MRYLSPSNASNEGRAGLSLGISDHVFNVVLTQGAATLIQIPDDAVHMVFSSTVDFFIRYGFEDIEPAVIPAANRLDGAGCELSPGMRTLDSDHATHISIIGVEAGQLSISFYGG